MSNATFDTATGAVTYRRFIILALLATMTLLNYLDRTVLSIAMPVLRESEDLRTVKGFTVLGVDASRAGRIADPRPDTLAGGSWGDLMAGLARARPPRVVQVGEPVGQARPAMQQRHRRLARHAPVAVGGAGDDLFDAVRASGADVYVTADLRHHPALEAREESRGGPPYLVDAGHWSSESVWLPTVRDALSRALRVDIDISTVRTDPWSFTVGAENLGGMP